MSRDLTSRDTFFAFCTCAFEILQKSIILLRSFGGSHGLKKSKDGYGEMLMMTVNSAVGLDSSAWVCRRNFDVVLSGSHYVI